MASPLDKRRMQRASDDHRPAVAIYRAPLFNRSETFIRAHPLNLVRYRPLLAGLEDKGNIPPELHRALFLPRGPGERLRGRLGDLRWLAPRLAPENPRLVHAHFGPDALGAVGLARQLGVPLVTTLHGYDVARTDRALLMSGRLSWMRYALRREKLTENCALFLTVSDALRARAVAAGFPPERTVTHYNGVDLARFPFADGDDGATILHVGRLVEKKGTALLLEAVAGIRAMHPAASLVIIGEGPLRASLERHAAQRGLGETVRFLGHQPQAVVSEWMRRAAVLAVPSLTAGDGDAEGLPNVVVEAAASGLPVVGSDHAGIPEAIDHGRSGFIVAEGNVEQLALRVGEVMASADLRRSMGAAARALAELRFDQRAQFALLERRYDALAASPTSSSTIETR
jgi:colanic acid/amylovoran biosynthesis glycosyltransferase